MIWISHIKNYMIIIYYTQNNSSQKNTFFAKALQALSIGHVKNQGAVVSRASDHLFQSRYKELW